MAVLNLSLWQERSQQHEGLSLAPDPMAQMQLSWVRRLEGTETGPHLLPAPCGSRAGCRSRVNTQEPGDDPALAQAPGPAPEAAACRTHPGAPRPARLPGQGLAPAPLPGLGAWLQIPLRSQPSAGTQALCAWSSVPAYSTHLLLLPA